MLRILRDDRELPRTTRVEFRGIKPMNGITTVADLLSKFRLAGHFRLIVDKNADPRFSLVRVRTGVVPLAAHMMAARNAEVPRSITHTTEHPLLAALDDRTTVHAS